MRKRQSVKTRSAASRKAWRTRKKMKAMNVGYVVLDNGLRTVKIVHDDGTPVRASELMAGREYSVDPETGVMSRKTTRKEAIQEYRDLGHLLRRPTADVLPNPWLEINKP